METWSVARLPSGAWKFSWVSVGGQTYEVWLNGLLLGSVSATGAASSFEVEDSKYQTSAPPVEIHNAEDGTAQSKQHPPFIHLQWRGIEGASGYTVQKFVNSAWSTVSDIPEDARGWYSFTTVLLEDGQSTQYRVMAYDGKGSHGDPIATTVDVTRNPSPPKVSYTLDSGDLVINNA